MVVRHEFNHIPGSRINSKVYDVRGVAFKMSSFMCAPFGRVRKCFTMVSNEKMWSLNSTGPDSSEFKAEGHMIWIHKHNLPTHQNTLCHIQQYSVHKYLEGRIYCVQLLREPKGIPLNWGSRVFQSSKVGLIIFCPWCSWINQSIQK